MAYLLFELFFVPLNLDLIPLPYRPLLHAHHSSSFKYHEKSQSVSKKETVIIPGFGKFVPAEVAERKYGNPQDHSKPKILKPATTRVKFRPFKHFKDCVAESKGR
mmetsp:Transcript_42807/g.78282  ORF Transcript_42807/g.78282 Transcript_42807/m.78282 type:complete len:105 (-) Transcript_42807:308-622(-)